MILKSKSREAIKATEERPSEPQSLNRSTKELHPNEQPSSHVGLLLHKTVFLTPVLSRKGGM